MRGPAVSSGLLMTGAVVAWGVLPAVLALSGAGSPAQSLWFVATLNFSGAAFALALFAVWRAVAGATSGAGLVRSVLRSGRLIALVLVDGALIAVSNAAFVWALSRQEDVLVALLVELWPLAAAFVLARFLPGLQPVRGPQVLLSGVAVMGVLALVGSGNGVGVRSFDVVPVAAAECAALAQAGAVLAHQSLLRMTRPGDVSLGKNFVLQSMRMLVAAVVSAGLLVVLGAVRGAPVPDASAWPGLGVSAWALLAGTGGFLVVTSALLYARALQRSDRALLTVMWFLAPVVSVCALVLVGQGVANAGVLVGGVLVLTANVLLAQSSGLSWVWAGVLLGVSIVGVLGLGLGGLWVPVLPFAVSFAVLVLVLASFAWASRRT